MKHKSNKKIVLNVFQCWMFLKFLKPFSYLNMKRRNVVSLCRAFSDWCYEKSAFASNGTASHISSNETAWLCGALISKQRAGAWLNSPFASSLYHNSTQFSTKWSSYRFAMLGEKETTRSLFISTVWPWIRTMILNTERCHRWFLCAFF